MVLYSQLIWMQNKGQCPLVYKPLESRAGVKSDRDAPEEWPKALTAAERSTFINVSISIHV